MTIVIIGRKKAPASRLAGRMHTSYTRTCLLVVVITLCGCFTSEPGPPGDKGPRGPAGPMGFQGPPGKGYRPVYWAACNVTLDLIRAGAADLARGSDGINETLLDYDLLAYNNGDLEVSCTAGLGALSEGGSGHYYPSITKGALNGTCIANVDYPANGPAGSVGFWAFSFDGAGPRAVYNDPDNPVMLNGFIYEYSEKDCNANMLGEDGKWTRVTLADVF